MSFTQLVAFMPPAIRLPFFARAGPQRPSSTTSSPKGQTLAPSPSRPVVAPSSPSCPSQPAEPRESRVQPKQTATKPKRPKRRLSSQEVEFPVCLPQRADTSHQKHRYTTLCAQRSTYRWAYDAVADAALIASLPPEENPNRRWIVLMRRMEDRCRKNSAAVAHFVHENNSQRLLQGSSKFEKQENDLFSQYKQLFATIDLPLVAKDNDFLRDDVFGWYRVAGPNPMELRRVCRLKDLHKAFPELTDSIMQNIPAFQHDSLITALREHRLYVVDYSGLESLRQAPGGKHGMYLYAPIALFAVPKTHRNSSNAPCHSPPLPIAIRCGQDITAWPLLTASTDYTSHDAWLSAKHTVQVADAFAHEAVHHFARTHLLMEAFVCASYRTLADTHPLLRLLRCHFEGTAFINSTSLTQLLCEGGTIDRLTAPPIAATRAFAASSLVGNFSFDAAMPDVELAERGVVSETSPLSFPYRDDALFLWKAIIQWVHSYLSVFYRNDHDICEDCELQAWGREVVWSGRIAGFGETTDGGFKTREYLTRVVAMIIFTASVQHAAVNFPQATHMQFAPAMPLAAFGTVDQGLLSMMPSIKHAEEQLCAAEMLGVVRYTRLGEYGTALEFGGETVDFALKRFQERLQDLQKRIEDRNQREKFDGLHAYDFLAPSKIPQSINV